MKKFVALVAVLAIAAILLAACGSSIVGKWSMAGMVEIEFKGDGTYVSTSVYSTESTTGTYKVSGDKITIDGSEGTFKIEGNTLKLTQEGITMELTRK